MMRKHEAVWLHGRSRFMRLAFVTCTPGVSRNRFEPLPKGDSGHDKTTKSAPMEVLSEPSGAAERASFDEVNGGNAALQPETDETRRRIFDSLVGAATGTLALR